MSEPVPVQHSSRPSTVDGQPPFPSGSPPNRLLIILFGSHSELWAPPLLSHSALSTGATSSCPIHLAKLCQSFEAMCKSLLFHKGPTPYPCATPE